MADLMDHSAAGPTAPNLCHGLFTHPVLLQSVHDVASKGKDATVLLHVGQAEHEIPAVARVQVVVCHRQDAVCVFHFVLFERLNDVGSVELEISKVLPRRDLVVLKEVVWNSGLDNCVATLVLLSELVARPD